jgi:hypothetical protein
VQIGGGVRVGDAFQAIVETETHRHMGNGELRPNFSKSGTLAFHRVQQEK